MARAKLWKDGKEFYTKALAVLKDKSKSYQPSEDAKVVDLDKEEAKEREVEEACHTNRALCNLELSAFKSLDCGVALIMWQRTTDLRRWTVQLHFA
jgi:hypothetical protein